MENQQSQVFFDSEIQYQDVIPICEVGELVFEDPETASNLSQKEQQRELAIQKESNNETSDECSLDTSEEQKQIESLLMGKLTGLGKIKQFQMSQQKLKYKMAIKMQLEITKLEKRIKQLAENNVAFKQKIQRCHQSTAVQEHNQQVADEEQIKQLNAQIEDLENEYCALQKDVDNHNAEQKIQNDEIMNGSLQLSSESNSSLEDCQHFEFYL
ncbi:hypothetical protein M3Y96_00742400 [Aphelenchoides besseyi]|nr:hypothetical protein M3Y96_00742400 [Aphelenchoides besseyi]